MRQIFKHDLSRQKRQIAGYDREVRWGAERESAESLEDLSWKEWKIVDVCRWNTQFMHEYLREKRKGIMLIVCPSRLIDPKGCKERSSVAPSLMISWHIRYVHVSLARVVWGWRVHRTWKKRSNAFSHGPMDLFLAFPVCWGKEHLFYSSCLRSWTIFPCPFEKRHFLSLLYIFGRYKWTHDDSFFPLSLHRLLFFAHSSVKPLQVKLIPPRTSIIAGKRIEFKCQSIGSRPRPRISWFKSTSKLTDVLESHSADSNVTISTVTFIPEISDNGKHLSCRADNPTIPASALEEGIRLHVNCKRQILVYNSPSALELYLVPLLRTVHTVFRPSLLIISFFHLQLPSRLLVCRFPFLLDYILPFLEKTELTHLPYSVLHGWMLKEEGRKYHLVSLVFLPDSPSVIFQSIFIPERKILSRLFSLSISPSTSQTFWTFSNARSLSSLTSHSYDIHSSSTFSLLLFSPPICLST